MKVTNNIKYIGVNDYKIDLFEGQYAVPNGMCYNSYVVIDEKIAVLDTVDASFTEEWLNNIEDALNGRKPDYLVVQHMEPDHSSNIVAFMRKYPEARIVANQKAFTMMTQFFDYDFEGHKLVVENGGTLSLGEHELTFIFAPMVHWPEVMVSYEKKEGVLFSADAFGKFGTMDTQEEWEDEARRYYIGIVGKYGAPVQTLLKKAAALDIRMICPLHGPVLKENLEHYIKLYDTWSSYRAESEGVMIAYTSIYGNTRKAVELLVEKLGQKGCSNVVVCDLAREDMAEAVANAFRYDKLVLATTTYNGDIFPFMKHFILHLEERNYQNRTIGLMENGSWACTAGKVMRELLACSKNLNWLDATVKINSSVKEQNLQQIEELANQLLLNTKCILTFK